MKKRKNETSRPATPLGSHWRRPPLLCSSLSEAPQYKRSCLFVCGKCKCRFSVLSCRAIHNKISWLFRRVGCVVYVCNKRVKSTREPARGEDGLKICVCGGFQILSFLVLLFLSECLCSSVIR